MNLHLFVCHLINNVHKLFTGLNQWDAQPWNHQNQQQQHRQQQQRQQQQQDVEEEYRDAYMNFEVGDVLEGQGLVVDPMQNVRVEGERRGAGEIYFLK